jgi:hypothetical protein
MKHGWRYLISCLRLCLRHCRVLPVLVLSRRVLPCILLLVLQMCGTFGSRLVTSQHLGLSCHLRLILGLLSLSTLYLVLVLLLSLST